MSHERGMGSAQRLKSSTFTFLAFTPRTAREQEVEDTKANACFGDLQGKVEWPSI